MFLLPWSPLSAAAKINSIGVHKHKSRQASIKCAIYSYIRSNTHHTRKINGSMWLICKYVRVYDDSFVRITRGAEETCSIYILQTMRQTFLTCFRIYVLSEYGVERLKSIGDDSAYTIVDAVRLKVTTTKLAEEEGNYIYTRMYMYHVMSILWGSWWCLHFLIVRDFNGKFTSVKYNIWKFFKI